MPKLAIHGGPRAVPEGLQQPWPPIDDTDRRYVLASLEGHQHAHGPNCIAFEKEFAAWNGNRHAINTNSGTAALHMGVAACGCGAGDEVIVTAYSWSSSATCILHHNSIPVFVDINFDTMNMDEDRIEAAITPKTKAIIAVHLHGLPMNMEKVMAIARRHGLKVIEDACQAHGATFQGRKVGTWGDCAAFSFNQNKCLCTGEGGMFVTDNEELFANAKQLWSFGETRTPAEDRDYHAYALGWMYRGNDITAAFGRAQLEKFDEYLIQIRENAARLEAGLRGIPYLILPQEFPGAGSNHYNYTIRFDMEALGHVKDASAFRDKLLKALQAEGVGTSVWQRFILPKMTVFQAKNGYGKGCPWSCTHSQPVNYDPADYPMASKHSAWHTGLTAPLRPPNKPDLAEAVVEAYHKIMGNLGEVEKIS